MAGDAERIAELEAENAALRARVVELTELVVALQGKGGCPRMLSGWDEYACGRMSLRCR